MDRSRGYNRTARKLLHIIAGLAAFALPFISPWLVLVCVIAVVVVAFLLKPQHAWWLRYISKPADRNKGVITGLRSYAVSFLVLVVLWILLDMAGYDSTRYIIFGLLALAWGDGLAGLLGPSPSKARTVPWNRHKTWYGLIGCYFGVTTAYIVSFILPFGGLAVMPMIPTLRLGAGVVVVVALLESIDLPLDDNYVVGLGAVVLAAAVHFMLL